MSLKVFLNDSYNVLGVELGISLDVPKPELRNFSVDVDDSFRVILPTTVSPMLLHGVSIVSSSNESVCRVGFDRRFVNCSGPGTAAFEVEYQAYGESILGNFTVELAKVDECAPPGCNGLLSLADLQAIDEELFGDGGNVLDEVQDNKDQ